MFTTAAALLAVALSTSSPAEAGILDAVKKGHSCQEAAEAAFEVGDVDGDQYLSQSEFDALVAGLGLTWRADKQLSLFQRVDFSPIDNRVEVSEWVAFACQHMPPPTTSPGPCDTTGGPCDTTAPLNFSTIPPRDIAKLAFLLIGDNIHKLGGKYTTLITTTRKKETKPMTTAAPTTQGAQTSPVPLQTTSKSSSSSIGDGWWVLLGFLLLCLCCCCIAAAASSIMLGRKKKKKRSARSRAAQMDSSSSSDRWEFRDGQRGRSAMGGMPPPTAGRSAPPSMMQPVPFGTLPPVMGPPLPAAAPVVFPTVQVHEMAAQPLLV